MNTTDFDVVICGAGPVGLSVAALLRQRGMPAARIAIIDAKSADQAAQDPRTLALSYGSRQILDQIGAWPRMAGNAGEIHRIHVSRRGHFGRTVIQCEDYDLPALGYVMHYGAMVSALTAILNDSGMTVLRPSRVVAIDESKPALEVHLADGSKLDTAVVVQAEGGIFSEQTAKPLQRDYNQVAIVAHVGVTHEITHCAFERFTAEGPLALLPHHDGYALVWCARPDTAGRLLALDDTDFLRALGQAFGGRLGRFCRLGVRNSYPLGLNAKPPASARVIAVGNAAQTLHPVAGQGFNLGLRDAKVLSSMLARDRSPTTLEQFARQRRDDRQLTIGLTDAMARIFASAPDGYPSQVFLGGTLGLLDVIAPAKRLLAHQFMFGWR
ncbi:FAD-dependent monooxygenase [Herbaspirillum sp. RV1423]|uniref:FAD-dependent monooxygenase n=1 Tax=Herbaspirillum sp. RV1423 TaxID=1443993 RepID=UPI0004B2C6FB|nr:FAD-dependent monooxygenase [Herbaspirillum sp. RV1423]